jgi:hypothetical protein
VLAAQAATKNKKLTDDTTKSHSTSHRGHWGGTKTGSADSRREAKDYSSLQCWHCKKMGHPRMRCPSASEEDKEKWLEISRMNFKKCAGTSEASVAKSIGSFGKQQEN